MRGLRCRQRRKVLRPFGRFGFPGLARRGVVPDLDPLAVDDDRRLAGANRGDVTAGAAVDLVQLRVLRDRIQVVRPVAALEVVRTEAGEHLVRLAAAVDRIIAAASADDVGAFAAVELVVACVASDGVGAASGPHRVVPGPGEDDVAAVQRTDQVVASKPADQIGAARADDRVVALGAVDHGRGRDRDDGEHGDGEHRRYQLGFHVSPFLG